MEEKSTGDFCGIVGLWFPEGWAAREITWGIVQHKQGLGIAAEAALRSRVYAYETLRCDSVYSCISADNLASIRLAEKLGVKLDREIESETRGKILIYRHSHAS